MRRALTFGTALILVSGLLTLGASSSANGHSVYSVQLDAPPPSGQPWSFLEFFPHGTLRVHQGDVIQADWGGTEAPHTATFVPASDANAWRAAHQGPSDDYALAVPDTAVGGDDPGLVLNPTVANPSSFACGDPGNPCSADGSSVVSSGLQNPDPGSQPSFSVQVDAPVGKYTFLCLLHPGMQFQVQVVKSGKTVPTPAAVAKRGSKQIHTALTSDGPAADAQAQELSSAPLASGHVRWTINAGGYSNQVSANEFRDNGVTLHLGDKLRVNESSDPVSGAFELHTATVPLSVAQTTPFVYPECEVPGPDTPPPCADPSEFRLALNSAAVFPTSSGDLRKPTNFVNSGLFTDPSGSFTFTARRPGTYQFVCLVHGPEMTTTVTVVK